MTCPTGISVAAVTPLGLQANFGPQNFPTIMTGIGAYATMSLSPLMFNYQQTRIIESVSEASRTCPTNAGFPPTTATGGPCFGNSTFIPGVVPPPGVTWGYNLPTTAAPNQFVDYHYSTNAADSLGGGPTCQIVCTQTYSCSGAAIPNITNNPNSASATFTITRTYTANSINGTSVTQVGVTKQ